MEDETLEYAGFWIRTVAIVIDTALLLLVSLPTLVALYGPGYLESRDILMGLADFMISWLFPAFAVVSFWLHKQATPGKMLLAARIVDARTGEEPTVGQWVKRYLAYFLSTLPFGLGFLWVAFDGRKQGWHDKLAGTVVVRRSRRGPQPVRFR